MNKTIFRVTPVIKARKITPEAILHLASLIKSFPSKSEAKQYVKSLNVGIGITFSIKKCK